MSRRVAAVIAATLILPPINFNKYPQKPALYTPISTVAAWSFKSAMILHTFSFAMTVRCGGNVFTVSSPMLLKNISMACSPLESEDSLSVPMCRLSVGVPHLCM
ncbi:hypothetical protein CEXT_607981 [Caerostris extrusa]|uniref:Secreted protein n=1 Tax=Caerostris extrusa TaxID=172846 RepID=A0AAV4XNC7_CAEEX|nr:hypothetical protein CEXT_607981 [Caerostris extrusa]